MRTFFNRIPTTVGASIVVSLALALVACESSDSGGSEPTDQPLAPLDEMSPALTDVDSLFEGAPSNDELPLEGKFDVTYPAKFDLVDLQSPVRNQASRGVCSIFSTVGLMEHLYIKEGTITNPDFSEQFLQWSVKHEVGAFKKTGGSSANRNLEAIHRYGVVVEADDPYETSAWDEEDDPACTGEDDQPTTCYTNGTPSDEALAAQRFHLPRGRWVNSKRQSIKAVMHNQETAVVAGMTFFYQSWNHRGSELEVNRDYFSEGYVLYPSEADKTDSLARRAGHSILLVGWDDDLEVQKLDEKGEPLFDEAGEPVMEKGFYLFKNSWGTGGFGVRSEFGPGYGWLSMEYVEEYATIYTSELPELELSENCSDGLDNNFDNLVDCDDSACAEHDACRELGTIVENVNAVAIPDNNSGGIVSELDVDLPGEVASLRVNVDIEHTYVGDLTVKLTAPSGEEHVLHDRKGGGQDNLKTFWKVPELVGVAAKGIWRLTVADSANGDDGQLVSWSLEFEVSGEVPAEVCDDGEDNDGNGAVDCADDACIDDEACAASDSLTYENNESVEIPDGDPQGILSTLVVEDEGTIVDFELSVDITHPYQGDLTVSLFTPAGELVTLFDKTGEGADNLVTTFAVPELIGLPLAGEYLLEVIDSGNLDAGTLNNWSITAQVQ